MVDTHLCSKLNNTGEKLTGVPPYCFIIVIVKLWAWCAVAVAVLKNLSMADNNGSSSSRCQNNILTNSNSNNTV